MDEDRRRAVGEHVERRRTAQGLSIQAALQRSGLSRTKWRDIEKARGKVPTPATLRLVAKGLGQSPRQILALAGYEVGPEEDAVEAPAAVDSLRAEIAALSAKAEAQDEQIADLRAAVERLLRS